jgi:hypothetical protein
MYVQADTVARWQRERFRRVLGTFIEKEPASPRKTRDGRRDSTSD